VFKELLLIRALRALLFILPIVSINSYGVCLLEQDAIIYECKRLPKGDDWCKKKHGSDYLAYYTTNTCNKTSAASLRGEDLTKVKDDDGGVYPAVCMTYESSQKYSCEAFDHIKATRYCHQNFGLRYLPFMEEGSCTKRNASKERGEVAHSNLLKGIKNLSEEIGNGLNYLDKDNLKGMGHFTNKRPALDSNFYTSAMKAIMAKMRKLRDIIYKNSHLNIPFKNKYNLKFVEYSLLYTTHLSRIYKLYAYVAHRNHYALKTYDFKTLEYLNLKVQKDYGLEIMAKATFMGKSIDNGGSVEFFMSEQDKQGFEYSAVEKPTDKVDYAKYITFVGSRENLTNAWAVDRLFPNPITHGQIRSCGKGFLSLRSSTGDIKKSAAYKELVNMDTFREGYAPRTQKLIELSYQHPLLTTTTATKLVQSLYYSVPEIKKLLVDAFPDMSYQAMLQQFPAEDAFAVTAAEEDDWANYSAQFFRAIVLPKDGVDSVYNISARIADDAYRRRLKTITDTIVSTYPWISNAAIARVETKIADYISKNIKSSWRSKFRKAIQSALYGYNSRQKLYPKRREEFVDRHLRVFKEFSHAAKVKAQLSGRIKAFPSGYKALQPVDITQLMSFYQNVLISKSLEYRETLAKTDYGPEIFEEFKDLISEKYIDSIWPYIKDGELNVSVSKRQYLLRKAAIDAAKSMKAKYKLDNRDIFPPPVYEVKRDATSRYDRTIYIPGNKPLQYKHKQAYLSQAGTRNRNNPDKREQPYEITEDGKIYSKEGNSLGELHSSVDIFKTIAPFEHKAFKKMQKELYFPPQVIRTNSKSYVVDKKRFVGELFKVFNLDLFVMGYSTKSIGVFAPSLSDQRALADQLAQQAYEFAPLLQHKTKVSRTETVYVGTQLGPRKTTQTITTEYSNFEYLGRTAVSNTLGVNDGLVKTQITKALSKAKGELPGKLKMYCDANYLNYKTDPNFKEVFKVSSYLREVLKGSYAMDAEYSNRLAKMDESIRKEIRTRWEKIQEDIIDPVAKITGYIALAAIAIMFIVGTGGVGGAGLLGLGYTGIAGFVALEFYIAFPFVAANAVHRLNKHFVETPHVLRMQESLATSMIDQSQLTSWSYLDNMKKSNRNQKLITVALLPLDFLYGRAVYRSITRSVGIRGVNAMRKLTKMKLKMWSAPPKSMRIDRSYPYLKGKHGAWKARWMKMQDRIRNLRMYQPKFQPLSDNTIKVASLRKGMLNRAKEVGVASKPWKFLDDLKVYSPKLRKRIEEYRRYVNDEGRIVREWKLKGNMKFKEAQDHAFKYSAVSYIPKSLWNHMKKGQMGVFFKNYGKIWEKLKVMQGNLANERYKKLRSVMAKLEKLQTSSNYGRNMRAKEGEETFFDTFLKKLTHDEILVLEEVTRRANGPLREFKQTFKLYKEVIQGLRPTTYLYGHIGSKYKSIYPQDMIMGEKFNKHYAYKNDTEDIVNFYESMMRHNAYSGGEDRVIRREVEELLSDRFSIMKNGQRFYKD
jgi:hypothetical protein